MTTPIAHSDRIEVQIDSLDELFAARTPSFERPDAPSDSGVERAIKALRRAGRRAPTRLVVRLSTVTGAMPAEAAIVGAIRAFAQQRAAELRNEAALTRRTGRIALWIAIVLMALALGGSAALSTFQPLPRLLNTLLVEGLIIAGWVVLWRPLDLLIFDSITPLVSARAHERLAAMEIRVDRPQ